MVNSRKSVLCNELGGFEKRSTNKRLQKKNNGALFLLPSNIWRGRVSGAELAAQQTGMTLSRAFIIKPLITLSKNCSIISIGFRNEDP